MKTFFYRSHVDQTKGMSAYCETRKYVAITPVQNIQYIVKSRPNWFIQYKFHFRTNIQRMRKNKEH